MLSNYFKVAIRNMRRHKGYAAINLIGLSLGLATGVLIYLFVTDELAFDKFHTKSDRLYRVVTTFHEEDASGAEGNGWPIGQVLRKDFPEVESVVYLRNASFLPIRHQGVQWREKSYFASEEFGTMFSFDWIKGNPATALRDPYAVVLTESLEKKYFPGESAYGKTLVIADTIACQVTGILRDIPSQSHMQFGMLLSFSTYQRIDRSFSFDDGWGNINMRNYVLLKPQTDVQAFSAKAKRIYMDRVGAQMKNWGMEAYLLFEPLTSIYLKSKSGNGMGPTGSEARVWLVTGTAIFVILLACINFINLATARSAARAKEVGLRKTVGSTRAALVRQFLSESTITTLVAFVCAIILIMLFLPSFNSLVLKNYSFSDLLQPGVVFGSLVLLGLISIMAGYYPAWVLSKVKPTEVLKGRVLGSTRGVRLRQVLVTFQFMVSVGLVIGTLVVNDQLEFMRTQNLGFVKDQVLVLDVSRIPRSARPAYTTFKNELAALPDVQMISFANAVPGRPGWQGQIASSEKMPAGESVSTEYVAIDEDYVKTLNLEIVAGRDFDMERKTDAQEGLLLNETAAAQFGWPNPADAIGQKIVSPSGYPAGTIVGIVKDYHELGLQQPIGAIAMDINPESAGFYVIRFAAPGADAILEATAGIWKKHFPENEFQYFFLDEDFERQYQSEKRLSRVFLVFSSMTIVIGVIGLLGLVSFMVSARTREIGIRKVMGASVAAIARLLSQEFIRLMVLANLLVIPIMSWVAIQWLTGFAYHTDLSMRLFAVTFLCAVLLTLITVSFQTIRAAMANPVKALRYE